MRRTILAALCMIGSLSAIAQSKFNVSGTILDQETNEAVMAATVRVLSLPDSAMAGGAATDANGAFSIKNIKKGKYAVKITYIGYQERVMPLDLTNKEEGKNVNIGYIRITSDSKLLKEAQVVANVAQMQVSGDSLVYNAQAFRVPEGSALEDLVKTLPGAKVDDEGNITINGKTVSKILVDGKEFFLNDTKIAMKNIPTNMIDKLKTYDRKSDFSRVTGIDDGEEETVLDLSVKKGMNNGWFGNFDAGIGTENRYAESL
ncbi:MAG: carboxypeptidase-like regulatory domain-containing protein, partial [Bacteroidaceae bacterium]|nr:carboxypeptidase-like regulatory domain-containing protein [Bacteroidaceae bacterium]